MLEFDRRRMFPFSRFNRIMATHCTDSVRGGRVPNRHGSRIRTLAFPAVAALALLWCVTGAASAAGLASVTLWANEEYQQSGPSAPTTPYAYFFTLGGSFQHRNEYNNVSFRYPVLRAPTILTITGKNFGYQGSNITPVLSFKLDYPLGNYVITAANGLTGKFSAVTVHYTAYHFSRDIPALTPAAYEELQQLNPSAEFTVHFNSFKPAAPAVGTTWFTIYTLDGSTIFSSGGLSHRATSVVIPANTLHPNTSYTFEVNFSDTITNTPAGGGTSVTQGFANRTHGSFTTGPARPQIPAAAPPPNPVHQALVVALTRYAANMKKATVAYRTSVKHSDWQEIHTFVGVLRRAVRNGNAGELTDIASRLAAATSRLDRDAGIVRVKIGGKATARPIPSKNPLIRAAVTRHEAELKTAMTAYQTAVVRADRLEYTAFLAAERQAMRELDAGQVVRISSQLNSIKTRLKKDIHSALVPPAPPPEFGNPSVAGFWWYQINDHRLETRCRWLKLDSDHRIAGGSLNTTYKWFLKGDVLFFTNNAGKTTVRLKRDGDQWKGHWVVREHPSCDLTISCPAAPN